MAQPTTNPVVQRIARVVIGAYMRAYHRLEVRFLPGFPKRGPVLAVLSHFSFLDALAAMVADPFTPSSTIVVKDSLMKAPLVGWVLAAWGVIPVARDGRDLSALRRIHEALKQGRAVCIAAEGTRSRSGRLGPLNRVLVKLAIDAAEKGIPVVPAAGSGTYEGLPPGALFPRPRKIRAVAGAPIDLSPWFGKRLSDADLIAAAARIQDAVAELLPPERRPAPGTPPLRDALAV